MNVEEKIMGKLAYFVTKYKWLVLSTGIVLFILSIIAAGNIEMKTEMKDMMPGDDPWIMSYTEIDDLFAGGSNVIITIEGNNKKELAVAAEEIARKIKANTEVMDITRAIDLKLEREFVENWGLLLQKEEDLERTMDQFAELNLLPFLRAMNDSFEETYTGDSSEEEMSNARQETEAVGMLNQMDEFFSLLAEYLENPDSVSLSEQGRILSEIFLYGSEYNFSPDNTMLMFTLIPDFGPIDFEEAIFMMEELNKIKDQVEREISGIEIGFTGDIPIQSDEQAAMGFDLMIPALVAFFMILVLFIFSFDQFRSVIFILISLIIGIVYNFGFLGITVKEINMMTSIMSVLLVGLGVDYGIQVVTNFNTYRREGHEPSEALRLTYTRAGMGIFLAALTTSLAFFVMAVTGSKAFAQFGMVLGTGILQCFISMFFLLPAFLLIFGKKDFSKKHLPNINYNFLAVLGKKAHKYRAFTIIAGIMVTGLLLFTGITANEMEYDLMAMEPQDMPSIIQYEKIMDKYGITPFQAMVVAHSVEEAREFTEALENVHLVGDISSISDLLPPADDQNGRLEVIQKIREMPQRYSNIEYSDDNLDDILYEIQRFEWNIVEMGDLSVAGLGENNKIVLKRNELVREVLGAEVGEPGKEIFQILIKLIESDLDKYGSRLTALDTHFAPSMDRIVEKMVSAERAMTINDLPDSIYNSFMDDAGNYNLITIFPKEGAWADLGNMERLNDVLYEISPRITGFTQITVAWMDEATSATLKAAIYIAAAVLIFLFISLRSVRYTLLAAAPLIIGMIWMLGIYPLVGMKLNILNIIMIPLVIGMGIDFGIHLSHRFQVEQDIDAVYRYTGKAVFLSAMTTMIGFGSLGLIGKFPSLASMGMILFVGIASCLAAALIVLPALLSFGNNGNGKGDNK